MKKSIVSILAALTCSFIVGSAGQMAFAQTTPQIAKGNCLNCKQACEDTLKYCAQKKGKYAEGTITNSLKDCAAACNMTADLLSRDSVLEKEAATLCIKALNSCIKTCESFSGDNNMKACADECRKAESNVEKVIAAH